MHSVLNEQVLVLNRLWQATDVTTVRTAFENVCRGAHTAIDTETMRPVTWEEWLTLPIREEDKSIATIHGPVRVPVVICAVRYDKMRMTRPRTVAERDGYICQVSGDYAPHGSEDHLNPISRGGSRTAWTNRVWMRRDLNNQKGSKTLHEMGWKLLRPAAVPRDIPAMVSIRRQFAHKSEWKPFLA
jgi:hypothetical protein